MAEEKNKIEYPRMWGFRIIGEDKKKWEPLLKNV